MNRVDREKEAVGLNRPFTPSDTSVPPAKEAFADNMANMQQNMDASKSN